MLETTRKFLLLRNESSEEVGESAKVAVGLTHGLEESCMQVSQDGSKLVQETKSRNEAMPQQVGQMESLLTAKDVSMYPCLKLREGKPNLPDTQLYKAVSHLVLPRTFNSKEGAVSVHSLVSGLKLE